MTPWFGLLLPPQFVLPPSIQKKPHIGKRPEPCPSHHRRTQALPGTPEDSLTKSLFIVIAEIGSDARIRADTRTATENAVYPPVYAVPDLAELTTTTRLTETVEITPKALSWRD